MVARPPARAPRRVAETPGGRAMAPVEAASVVGGDDDDQQISAAALNTNIMVYYGILIILNGILNDIYCPYF